MLEEDNISSTSATFGPMLAQEWAKATMFKGQSCADEPEEEIACSSWIGTVPHYFMSLTNLFYLSICLYLAWFLLKRFVLEKRFLPMKDKYVFITGCDSGFGRLLSLHLAGNGVNVFAGCYTEKGREELLRVANEMGNGKMYPIELDVTKESSVDAAYHYVRTVLAENNASLWALVNNAGIFSIFGPDDWCTVEEYKNSLDVNCLGAVRMCHRFTSLVKHSKGRIVTMGSSAGRLHGQFVGPYCTAKFAVEAYMDCLRFELRRFGVSVHILEPGAFKTDLLNEGAQNRRVDTIWDRLPEQVKLDYGMEFKENFKQAWSIGVNIVANENLMWVVDNYTHALFAEYPRLRYYTGYDAIFAFIPLSLVPTAVQDAILSFMYSLQPGPPLEPECLRTKKNYSKTNGIVPAMAH